MRRWVTRQESRVHSDAAMEPHEIRHRRAAEGRTRGTLMSPHSHVLFDHLAIGIDKTAVEARNVIGVFIEDGKTARRRAVTFAP